MRADLAFIEHFPHHGGGLVQVGRELVEIPAKQHVALVGVERTEHAVVTRDTDLVLVGVAGEVRVVAFEVELEDVDQVIGAQEVACRGRVEVVLVRRRFLGLRLDEELGVHADLLGVVGAHVKNFAMCSCSRFMSVTHRFS